MDVLRAVREHHASKPNAENETGPRIIRLKNVAMIRSPSAPSLVSSFKLACTLRSPILQNNQINNFAALYTPSERHVSFTAAKHGIETLFHNHESCASGAMDGLGDRIPSQSMAPRSLVLPQLNRCRHDQPSVLRSL
jgi:hypothetical protein